MLGNAESVAVAQGILNTCRKALERIQESVESNTSLVASAKTALQQEREQAAQDLAEARRQAQVPAEQAAAATVKADSWLETGQREATDFSSDGVTAALASLEKARDEVKTLSLTTAEVAIDANFATTLEDAAAVEVKVAEAANTAIEAAKKTREALETLRAAIQDEKEARAEMEALQLESAGHTTEAEKVRDVITGTLAHLEEVFTNTELSSEPLTSLKEQAKKAGDDVVVIVSKALEHTKAAIEGQQLELVKTNTEQARLAFEETVIYLSASSLSIPRAERR